MPFEVGDKWDWGRYPVSKLDRPYSWEDQKPYRNGIVVYSHSTETCGGMVRGQVTRRVAVKDGIVVATYYRDPGELSAFVGKQEIRPDLDTYASGEVYVSRKALPKWIEAVKAL